MNRRFNNRVSTRVSHPLTAKFTELAGPLPPIAVAPSKCSLTNSPRVHRRPTPAAVISRIAEDAARACRNGGQDIVSVAPAESTDPLLLFLRRDGETQLMLGVPPEIVRSPRLRGEHQRRDRHAEHEYELMRVAEAGIEYEVEPVVDSVDAEDDDTEL